MNLTSPKVRRIAFYAVALLALIYAFLAGLRTVSDFDLGWQLATGRWVVQHHHVPSVDVFSYTAAGRPWIYPPFAGVIFYFVYLMGGYAALSWIPAFACAATVAILLRRGGVVAAALAVIAVPIIAVRTDTRAEVFTAILFAAFLSILWQYYRTGRATLWLLPLLMVAWVNLHLGFISGLGMCAAYVMFEVLDLPFAARRAAAVARLRRAVPWLAATWVATFVNPWGPYLYSAFFRQERSMIWQQNYIGEWAKQGIGFFQAQFLTGHDPDSAIWWMLVAAVAAIAAALWRRNLGAAVLLAAATYEATQYIRYHALFACIVVVIGGAMLAEIADAAWPRALTGVRRLFAWDIEGSRAPIVATLVIAALAFLVGIRSADLVTNRFYVGRIALFGPGVSWWFPRGAVDFIKRNHLPGRILNDYNIGGFLTWELPEYPDYIDGRAVPFGPEIFFQSARLETISPDSAEWQKEADARGINTAVFSAARYLGLISMNLPALCGAKTWRVVYFDDVSIVLLRNTPENADLIRRFALDCASAQFNPAPNVDRNSFRGRGELFNYETNLGSLLFVLGRDTEAIANLTRANDLYPADNNLHMILGQGYDAAREPDLAEKEYQLSIRLKPTDIAWFLLGRLYMSQGRYLAAADAYRHSAEISFNQAYDRYRLLGDAYLNMGRPQDALAAFDQAMEHSPYENPTADPGPAAAFHADIADGRARAWRSLGDIPRAIDFEKQAVALTPQVVSRWIELAAFYRIAGKPDLEAEAKRNAEKYAMAQVPSSQPKQQ